MITVSLIVFGILLVVGGFMMDDVEAGAALAGFGMAVVIAGMLVWGFGILGSVLDVAVDLERSVRRIEARLDNPFVPNLGLRTLETP